MIDNTIQKQLGPSQKLQQLFVRYLPSISNFIGKEYQPLSITSEKIDDIITVYVKLSEEDYNHILDVDELSKITVSGIRKFHQITAFEPFNATIPSKLFYIDAERGSINGLPCNVSYIDIINNGNYNGKYKKISSINGRDVFECLQDNEGELPTEFGGVILNGIHHLNNTYQIEIHNESEFIVKFKIENYDGEYEKLVFDDIYLSYLYERVLALDETRFNSAFTQEEITSSGLGECFIVIDPTTFKTSESKSQKTLVDSSYDQYTTNSKYWKNASINMYYINDNCESVDAEMQYIDKILSMLLQINDADDDVSISIITNSSNQINITDPSTGKSKLMMTFTVQFRIAYDYSLIGTSIENFSYPIERYSLNENNIIL